MKTMIGLADMKFSNDPESILTTHSLGACIAVTLYDPEAKMGGILHFMLPESGMDPQKARKNPWIFADTGLPLFFQEAYRRGAEKKRILLRVVGGGEVMGDSRYFNLGKKNYLALRKILWNHEFLIASEDVGGNLNRGVWLEVATGKVWVITSGDREREI